MNTVDISRETLDRLSAAGSDFLRQTVLFEVSKKLVDDCREWSGPVQFRFVAKDGCWVELEVRAVEWRPVEDDAA